MAAASASTALTPSTAVFTLTFGDAAENHVGMEMIGMLGAAGSGFSVDELHELAARLEAEGATVEVHELHSAAGHSEAAVLVIRDALGDTHGPMFEEHAALEHDKKAFMYGRVVNKKARWNLCFDDVGHVPDYAAGKGRVIAYDEIPHTKTFRASFEALFGPKAAELKGEGNYYYDLKKCGIGWHGDGERRKVVAVRLGGSMPIHFRWYHKSEPVGDVISIPLHGGDLYIMSEKAVGNDWKSRSKWTLRHATGALAGL